MYTKLGMPTFLIFVRVAFLCLLSVFFQKKSVVFPRIVQQKTRVFLRPKKEKIFLNFYTDSGQPQFFLFFYFFCFCVFLHVYIFSMPIFNGPCFAKDHVKKTRKILEKAIQAQYLKRAVKWTKKSLFQNFSKKIAQKF